MSRTKKKKARGMSQLSARIIGMILMAFIVVVLVLIAYRFMQAMDNNAKRNPTPTPVSTQAEAPPAESPSSDKPTSNARYDFYQELTHRRAEVDAEIERKSEENAVTTDMRGNYFRVQVGAFREKEQADRMRARMILRDYPVTIVQSGSFYLVQVGPYQEKAYAQSVQKRLQREGVDTLLKSYVNSQ